MARYAIIEDATGTVVNVCEMLPEELTKENGWRPPGGHHARPAPTARTGDTWDGNAFIPAPVPPPPSPVLYYTKAELDALADGVITVRDMALHLKLLHAALDRTIVKT